MEEEFLCAVGGGETRCEGSGLVERVGHGEESRGPVKGLFSLQEKEAAGIPHTASTEGKRCGEG